MTDHQVKTIDVVVGLISGADVKDSDAELNKRSAWQSSREYLIAERTDGPHNGLWEFPGGKVDPGETQYQALCREIEEEVALTVHAAAPYMTIETPSVKDAHFFVRLHLWTITEWSGEASGVEGQKIRWTPLTWEDQHQFLPANSDIFTALRLGHSLAFFDLTDSQALADIQVELQRFEQLQEQLQGQLMLRLRCRGMSPENYYAHVSAAQAYLEKSSLKTMVDVLPDRALLQTDFWANSWNVAGYFPSWWQKVEDEQHLRQALDHLRQAPGLLRGASCHNSDELYWACKDPKGIQAHFYCLSPLYPTNSHPGAPYLGWPNWASLNRIHPQPGFALGGVKIQDLEDTRQHGGFGVAGTSGFRLEAAGQVEQR